MAMLDLTANGVSQSPAVPPRDQLRPPPACMLTDMSKAGESSNPWSLGERPLAYDPESALGGADVAELQGLLGGLGYQLPNDGSYGPTTAEQVRQFQEHRRLGVDGVFGPVTSRELTRVRTLVNRPVKPHYLRK